ncbi:MAG: hypothetical protein COA58_06305 [Bacteroidetes bacterium]|nr:MAG: hypothetical protein COA58_06305 [Bacteroidota bacterium]
MILAEIKGFEVLVNILNFVIPALIVFGVTYYIINKFMDEQRKVRLLELKKEQIKEITPVKLQAYERLTLFLDRIGPDNLVLRLSKSGQSSDQLRLELIQTITSEFNHNISQQIYVSNDCWNMIKAVKEQIIAIVEVCHSECDENETGAGLGKKILTRLMNEKVIPTQRAIELLKQEIEIAL